MELKPAGHSHIRIGASNGGTGTNGLPANAGAKNTICVFGVIIKFFGAGAATICKKFLSGAYGKDGLWGSAVIVKGKG